jgi:hypothetical protein
VTIVLGMGFLLSRRHRTDAPTPSAADRGTRPDER